MNIKEKENLIKFIERNNLPVSFVRINQIHGWDERDAIPEKLAELKKSIEKEGIKEPVDVSIEMNDGNNISFTGQNGKHRYLAMKQLGYTIVPCKIM